MASMMSSFSTRMRRHLRHYNAFNILVSWQSSSEHGSNRTVDCPWAVDAVAFKHSHSFMLVMPSEAIPESLDQQTDVTVAFGLRIDFNNQNSFDTARSRLLRLTSSPASV